MQLRASFDVGLSIEGQPVSGGTLLTQPIAKPVQLYGPGDIVGIEPRAIFKTEPLNWITNFEPNYLPYIEFYEEDFPWRYTPAHADEAAHRLRPWITLVVLEEGEFKDGQNLKDKLLPVHRGRLGGRQVPAGRPALGLGARARQRRHGGQRGSESPRPTWPPCCRSSTMRSRATRTSRTRACCVRASSSRTRHITRSWFRHSRPAGARASASRSSRISRRSRPGVRVRTRTEFPYYHRWFFRTGILGDFEYLVRLLKAKPADQRVGRRDMDLQEPGWNLSGLDPDGTLGGILRLGGALRVPEIVIEDMEDYLKYENWAVAGYPQPIQSGIANFLNLADEYQKPGAESAADSRPRASARSGPADHAAAVRPLARARSTRLLTAAGGTSLPNNRNWIHELNLDPRFRVPAGFGTRVIQKHQEEYMNVAWQQVGDVVAVNRLIRFVQLTNEALLQWHTRQLQPLLASQPDKLMWLTAPVQKRILIQSSAPVAGAAAAASAAAAPAARVTKVTVAHQLKTSLVPPVAVSAQMRRILRPRGRVVKQLPFAARNAKPHDLVRRLNAGEVLPAPVKPVPAAPLSEADAGGRRPATATAALARQTTRAFPVAAARDVDPRVARARAGAGPGLARRATRALGGRPRRRRPRSATRTGRCGAYSASSTLRRCSRTARRRRRWSASAPKSPDFRLADRHRDVPAGRRRHRQRGGRAIQAGRDRDVRRRRRRARGRIRAAEAGAEPRGRDGAESPTRCIPAQSLPRLVLDRILLPGRFVPNFDAAQVDEIMNYPRFDLPMYKPLVDLNSEWFLPNLNRIPPDSITLLETNQKFIEAYMVGLNHEMARELLWREYPTDQRGSYFRQFWDVSGYLPETGEDLTTLTERLQGHPGDPHLEAPVRARRSRQPGSERREGSGGRARDPRRAAQALSHGRHLRPQGQVADEEESRRHATPARSTTRWSAISPTFPRDSRNNPPRDIVKTPLYSAKVEPDIYFFGFDLTAEVAKGSDGSQPGDENKPGWFFVIKERPGEPRFGFDLGGPNAEMNTWSDVAWEDVAPGLPEGGFLEISGGMLPCCRSRRPMILRRPSSTRSSSSMERTSRFPGAARPMRRTGLCDLQVPVMVAVHASEMLTIKK